MEFKLCSVKEVEMNKAVLPRKVGILPWISEWIFFFSFLAGSVLSAALSIMFAFYKSVIKRKFVSVFANFSLAAVF